MSDTNVTYHGITFNGKTIEAFCLNNGIKKLSLFGSVLRDDFVPESDIDVLVEFMPEAKVGFFELFDMQEELSQIFGGRKIDLRTPNELHLRFREIVLKESELQYAR